LPEGFTLPRVITSGDEKPMYQHRSSRSLQSSDHGGGWRRPRTNEKTTAHLEASRGTRSTKSLDPKFLLAGPAAGQGVRRTRRRTVAQAVRE
jgi:hypothetical protein